MNQNEHNVGVIYTLVAYIIWGFLPIYWKLVSHVSPGEVLAHRIVWSFVLMVLIVIMSRKWRLFIQECKKLIKEKKKLIAITTASLIISMNWLTYIWAVNEGHVIQASLGYYINPLVNIILAVIFLKESLTKWQKIAVILAGIGVTYLTFSFGVFPWIALFLAFSFALYGLIKKLVDIEAMFGLTVETMIITPIAAIYLFTLPKGTFSTYFEDFSTFPLLIGTGIATALPLLFFAFGARRISLSLLGILQYIAPTIMLFIGIFLYKESFTTAHLIAFAFIWSALILYMSSMQRKRPVMQQRKIG